MLQPGSIEEAARIDANCLQVKSRPRSWNRDSDRPAMFLLAGLFLANIDFVVRCQSKGERECYKQIGYQASAPLIAAIEPIVRGLEAYVSSSAGGSVFKELQQVTRQSTPEVAAELEAIADAEV